jgi:putative ABC transport system permease protein
MRLADVLTIALGQIRGNLLRSFFTLVGIIVSVAFLVAVVAIIQGMNAYVKENIADAMIGTNAFQVRRTPIKIGLFDDDDWLRIRRRPRVTLDDAAAVASALPDAEAVGVTSGWPTPQADVVWRDRTLGDVLVFGVTAPYQVVQDFRVAAGRALTDLDVRERRPVAVIGWELRERLFEGAEPVGKYVRILGERYRVVGVMVGKGRVLGQSFDGYVLLPITTFETIYGRRQTTTVSVKMRILFSVVPAVVGIGVVVGGIVIMNIMLMSVTERTHEIGIRKAVGASAHDIRKQFLAESILLASLGGVLGLASGWAFAELVALVSPHPAPVTLWSVAVAVALGAGVGVVFGVYPASRAARLDPIAAMRSE